MHMPDDDCHVISRDSGLYEPLAELDTVVESGTPVGQVHSPECPDREPVVYRARRDGVLIGRAHKVLVSPGDFLAMLAEDMPTR